MVQKAIKAVKNQEYPSWNLYILDNNSVDSVKRTLLPYAEMQRVALFINDTQAHQRLDYYWLGRMLNIGLRQGKETYIQPLTDDCYPLPNCLRDKVSYMKENPKTRLCFGEQLIFDIKGNLIRTRNKYPRGHLIYHGSCVVDLCQTMYHRQFLERIGGFNENMKAKPYPWIDAISYDRAEELKIPLHSVGTCTDVFVEHKRSQMAYLQSGRYKELLSNDIWE
jgi:hypothetical protein